MRRAALVIGLAACGAPRPAPAPPSNHSSTAPAPAGRAVLVVGEDDLYLEGALETCPDVKVVKATPEDYVADPAALLADARLVVFDDYTPEEEPPPPVSAIYFHPNAGSSPVPIARTLDGAPRITEIDAQHPVMRDVSLSDASFGSLEVFAPRAARHEASLASSGGAPVIAARVDAARKLLLFGFSLRDSDLPLRTAFPILLVNALAWLGVTCS